MNSMLMSFNTRVFLPEAAMPAASPCRRKRVETMNQLGDTPTLATRSVR
jgi:hypothetical protein